MAENFPQWLRDEVGRRGWQQKDLARAVGVSQQTASRWLLGQAAPTARSVRSLAEALGASSDEVLERLGTPAAPASPPTDRPSLDAEVEALRQRVEQLEAQLGRRRRA